MIYREYIKRVLDFVFALILLILLSPLLLVVTIWLHFANKGAGAFFTQERPGKDEKIFKLYKFKSMTDERDAEGNLLPDAERITRAGRFVRSTSIDELPQLWNVLKGEMSFIGPRPLTPIYLQVMSDYYRQRHQVRPGISGLAQVKGRNNLKLSRKFRYDVFYAHHINLQLDLMILAETICKVLKRQDIGEGDAVMMDIDDLGYEPRIIEILERKECRRR